MPDVAIDPPAAPAIDADSGNNVTTKRSGWLVPHDTFLLEAILQKRTFGKVFSQTLGRSKFKEEGSKCGLSLTEIRFLAFNDKSGNYYLRLKIHLNTYVLNKYHELALFKTVQAVFSLQDPDVSSKLRFFSRDYYPESDPETIHYEDTHAWKVFVEGGYKDYITTGAHLETEQKREGQVAASIDASDAGEETIRFASKGAPNGKAGAPDAWLYIGVECSGPFHLLCSVTGWHKSDWFLRFLKKNYCHAQRPLRIESSHLSTVSTSAESISAYNGSGNASSKDSGGIRDEVDSEVA